MAVKNILTNEQVREAIYQDDDFPDAELLRLSQVASSFVKRKTNYDFAQDEVIEPLAIQCAKMYVKQLYFNGDGFDERFDYSFGLTSLIIDLQSIAEEKAKQNEEETEIV